MDDNVYSAPKAELSASPAVQPERPESRGGCLTVFLVFGLIANTFSSIFYIKSLIEGSMSGLPMPPQWAVVALCVGGAINIVSCLAVWQWRRWGVYTFFGTAAVAFGVNVAIGIPPFSIAMGLLGVVVLAFLIRPVWRYMR